jgi:hypothetical protein
MSVVSLIDEAKKALNKYILTQPKNARTTEILKSIQGITPMNAEKSFKSLREELISSVEDDNTRSIVGKLNNLADAKDNATIIDKIKMITPALHYSTGTLTPDDIKTTLEVTNNVANSKNYEYNKKYDHEYNKNLEELNKKGEKYGGALNFIFKKKIKENYKNVNKDNIELFNNKGNEYGHKLIDGYLKKLSKYILDNNYNPNNINDILNIYGVLYANNLNKIINRANKKASIPLNMKFQNSNSIRVYIIDISLDDTDQPNLTRETLLNNY